MRKWLVIFGMLLTVSPIMPGQPNDASSRKQQATNQIEAKSKAVGADKIDKQANSQADQAKPGGDPPGGNAPIERSYWWTIPDWWLVIIAGCTGLVIGWQSSETRRAAKGANKAADTALKTVQVMIDSERPWVIANMEQSKSLCLLDNGNVRFTWTVKNVGRSPAKLIEAGAMVSLDTMGPPIDQVHYKMEPLDERILVPGATASFFVFWSIVENGRIRTQLGKTPEEFNDLAMVHGCIRYRSAIKTPDIYETRFSESSPISGGRCDGFEPSWPTAPEDIRCT